MGSAVGRIVRMARRQVFRCRGLGIRYGHRPAQTVAVRPVKGMPRGVQIS